MTTTYPRRPLDTTWNPAAEEAGEQRTLPAPLRDRPPARGAPPGYGAIVLGSGLLMVASAFFAPLGPAANAPLRGLVTFLSAGTGLGLLLGVALRAPRQRARAGGATKGHTGAGSTAGWPRGLVLALAAPLVLGSLVGLTGMTWLVLSAPPSQSYVTDIVSLTHEEATLVLAGRNPYTAGEGTYRDALTRFAGALGTPVRGPVFGTSYDEPLPGAIARVQREYVASPQRVAGAFDPRTLHSYPALSFLLYVPWLWAGGQNILAVHLLVYWLLFAWLVWLTPVGWRQWGALAALAAMPTVMASLIESDEVICIALVLLAWHLLRQAPSHRRPGSKGAAGQQWGWVAPVLLGLACAFKQYAWFFVPVFAVEVVRSRGWHTGLRWALIGLAAFLLPNLPYLLASPHAWWTSLWIPMSDPLFAVGIGIVQLSTSHLLPYAPQAAYALLEAIAMVAMVVFDARAWPRLGAGALLLALVPLYFAFRSTPNYFAFAPWLALYAVTMRNRVILPARGSPVVRSAAYAARALSAGRADYWLLRAGIRL